MSSSGTPRRYATATPSPVSAYAFEVIFQMRPKPPVAKMVDLAWKVWISPLSIWMATTPATCPCEFTRRSNTWYSSKKATLFLMHC